MNKDGTPPPDARELAIGVRGVMVRDGKMPPWMPAEKTLPEAARSNTPPRRRRCIIIADPPIGGPSPLLAVALTADTRDWRITHEMLIYRDGGREEVERYIAERIHLIELPAGDGKIAQRLAWRDEPRVRVSAMPLADFGKLFRRHAHDWRNLVIGYGQPRALAHIATGWDEVERGEKFAKAWALELLAPKAGAKAAAATKRHRAPGAFVKLLPAGAQRIELRGFGPVAGDERDEAGEAASYHRGQFLDLVRLAKSLSGEEHSLESALAAFSGEVLEACPDPIEHHRRRARAMLALAKALIGIFDVLPVSRARGGTLSETRVQSASAVTRSLAGMIGVPQAPEILQPDRLGAVGAAFMGGRIGARWRGIASVAALDFSKTYPWIAALTDLQRFLFARAIRFEEATEDARDLAARLGRAELFDKANWPKLAALCWVKLRGEVVPTSALYDGKRFGMGMPARWSDRLVPLMLPDLIAAKLLCRRIPEIVRAERMVPVGRRSLSKVRLPSGFTFDPVKHDLFRTLVEKGERLRLGIGDWRVRAGCLYPAWKAGNNGLAFGQLAQTNVIDKPGDAKERVTLLFDERELSARTAHPEEPGRLFCLPLAALVTSCARLLLAMVDDLVAEKGGIVAMGHTDSAFPIATEEGGQIFVAPGGGPASRKIPVHALSRREVEEICAAFAPLNIFDRELMPGSPLKFKGLHQALVLSGMHYCLIGPDGAVTDGTRGIFGNYLSPTGGDPAHWHLNAWQHVLDKWRGRYGADKEWLRHPAVTIYTLSRPAFAEKVPPEIAERPFDPFLCARVIGRRNGEKTRVEVVVAPYETMPERWAELPWRLLATSETVTFGKADRDGWAWRLGTIAEVLDTFAGIHPHAMLDETGAPCTGETRGLLKRVTIRDGKKFVTGKERLNWSDDPARAFETPDPEMWPADPEGHGDPPQDCDWPTIRAALAIVDTAAMAARMKYQGRSVRKWRDGSRTPEEPRDVAAAIVACAADLGLFLPGDETLSDEQFCALLPERVGRLQLFLSAVVEIFGQACGFSRLADGDRVPEQSLRNWRDLGLKGGLRTLDGMAAVAARLGKIARARISAAGHRTAFDDGLIGHLQAIYAALSFIAGHTKPLVIDRAEMMSYMGGIASLGFSIWPHPAAEIAGRLGKESDHAGRPVTNEELAELMVALGAEPIAMPPTPRRHKRQPRPRAPAIMSWEEMLTAIGCLE